MKLLCDEPDELRSNTDPSHVTKEKPSFPSVCLCVHTDSLAWSYTDWRVTRLMEDAVLLHQHVCLASWWLWAFRVTAAAGRRVSQRGGSRLKEVWQIRQQVKHPAACWEPVTWRIQTIASSTLSSPPNVNNNIEFKMQFLCLLKNRFFHRSQRV